MVIRRHTMTLIWLNFVFLLFIEFQPPINALHAIYPISQLTTILYASNQALTDLMLLAIWLYAAQGHWLIDKSIDRSQIISIELRVFLTPMIFLLSIALIFFRNDYALYYLAASACRGSSRSGLQARLARLASRLKTVRTETFQHTQSKMVFKVR